MSEEQSAYYWKKAYSEAAGKIVELESRIDDLIAESARLREELNKPTDIDFDFNPRATKLIAAQKPFLVVSEDEPYYMTMYNVIRLHEIRKGQWTEADELQWKEAYKRITKDSSESAINLYKQRSIIDDWF